jgi:hypothetical protein
MNPNDVISLGGTLRFNVVDKDRRSVDWRVWTSAHADDVYVAARLVVNSIKISLHESGSWQHGFVSDEKAKAFRPEEESRHFYIWNRPPELVPGWTRAIRIVIPYVSLQERSSTSSPRKPVIDILPVAGYDTMIVDIWLESPDSQTPPPLKGSQLAGRLQQSGGGMVWVAAHPMKFPVTLYKRFEYEIDNARADAMRQHPEWTGDPPLAICVHDNDRIHPELVLFELAVRP